MSVRLIRDDDSGYPWLLVHQPQSWSVFLTDDELRDLVRQAALEGISNRTGEPD